MNKGTVLLHPFRLVITQGYISGRNNMKGVRIILNHTSEAEMKCSCKNKREEEVPTNDPELPGYVLQLIEEDM